MRNILACVTALAALAAPILGRADPRPCQLQSLGELAVTRQGGHFLVDATIDGKPAPLVLDTGSFGTLLFKDAVARLGLFTREIPNVTIYGVGGGAKAYSAEVKELRVANLSLRDAELMVTGHDVGGPAVGVLGAQFLLQTDVEFDLAHDRLRFFRSVGCTGDQVVYWGAAYAVAPMSLTREDQLLVRVGLDSESIEAQMDTGAPRSILASDVAARLRIAATPIAGAGPARGMGGAAPGPVATARLNAFRFGEETVGHPAIEVANLFGNNTYVPFESRIATRAVDDPQMLLGADFFLSHRIYVAVKQGKVYASYLGGPVFAPAATAVTTAKGNAP